MSWGENLVSWSRRCYNIGQSLIRRPAKRLFLRRRTNANRLPAHAGCYVILLYQLMGLLQLILLSVGLAMDAFAVSVCRGVKAGRRAVSIAVTIGLIFGFFQGVMPLIGWLVGSTFAEELDAYDHWIAFVLLALIGGKMVIESFSCPTNCEEKTVSTPRIFHSGHFFVLISLAIATSIDALAVGLTFAFMEVHILTAVLCIGIVTAILSLMGVLIGRRWGARKKHSAELFGGIILILLGLKIFFEHMGWF